MHISLTGLQLPLSDSLRYKLVGGRQNHMHPVLASGHVLGSKRVTGKAYPWDLSPVEKGYISCKNLQK